MDDSPGGKLNQAREAVLELLYRIIYNDQRLRVMEGPFELRPFEERTESYRKLYDGMHELTAATRTAITPVEHVLGTGSAVSYAEFEAPSVAELIVRIAKQQTDELQYLLVRELGARQRGVRPCDFSIPGNDPKYRQLNHESLYIRVVAEFRAAERLVKQQTSTTPDTTPTSREQQATWLAEALLLVRDHPGWSDAKIARRVGKAPSTLSRDSTYRTAAAMARASKGSKDDVPKGHITVDSETGMQDVEAVSTLAGQPDDKADRGQPITGSKYFLEYCDECGEPIKVTQDKVDTNPVCDYCRI